MQIYSYDRTSEPDLPRCEWKNADEILPYDVADRYRRRLSITFASDIFRYQLLYQKGGWYFDTDCVLIKPLNSLFDSQYVFGWEDSSWVGSAVIKFPANHELMADMYLTSTQLDPKEYFSGHINGPKMFTKYLRDYGFIRRALSPEYFYPIHWSNMEAFRRPFTPSQRSFIVHLWSKILRAQNWKPADLDHSFSSMDTPGAGFEKS